MVRAEGVEPEGSPPPAPPLLPVSSILTNESRGPLRLAPAVPASFTTLTKLLGPWTGNTQSQRLLWGDGHQLPMPYFHYSIFSISFKMFSRSALTFGISYKGE